MIAPSSSSAMEPLREMQRNQQLRRIDWRFLLPSPRLGTTLVAGDAQLADAIRLVSPKVVRLGTANNETYDFVAASQPDFRTLQALNAKLRPGGACYCEWLWPNPGGTSGIRRRMEAAGFHHVQCYWVWPGLRKGTAQWWLPLNAPEVASYFLRSRPQVRSFRHRMLAKARTAAWRFALHQQLLAPIVAIGHKHDGQQQTAGEGDVFNLIRAQWKDWGFENMPQRLTRLQITGGRRSINKVVSLVFADNEAHPRLVIKQARVDESVPALMQEATILRAVAEQRAHGLPGVPRVLFTHVSGHDAAIGQTAHTGVPLTKLMQPTMFAPLAHQVTDWLLELAQTDKGKRRSAMSNHIIQTALADVDRSFGSALPPGLLEQVAATLCTLPNLPVVCEQRDCSPWNIFKAIDGRLIVLDWESAVLDGLPALDLIYFLTYWSFYFDNAISSGQFRTSYRTALNKNTPTGLVQAQCLSRYLERLSLDPAVLHPLRLLTWLIHARSEYQRLVADAGGLPPVAALRQSVFIGLLEEEVAAIAQ